MHIETPNGWDLDVERVSTNAWELPFAAWVTGPYGIVVAYARGLTQSRAVSAVLFDLCTNCSDASAETIDCLSLSFRHELARAGRGSWARTA